MSTSPETPEKKPSIFRNYLSTTGLVILAGAIFSFLLLLFLDATSGHSNPYVGILTYMVAPAFVFLGLALLAFGGWRMYRQIKRETGEAPPLRIDLTLPRSRRAFGIFLAGSLVFLLLSAIGSYQTYHFTESVTFCGETCHEVMEPEHVTYMQGTHARVACAECHIGEGAGWFVKSKLSGSYQVYATAFNKYPRPIPTPIENLRPARETCERCHWPQKFSGDLERTYRYYLTDETNTPFTVRMLMHVGGAGEAHGPVGGIHNHINPDKKIEYLPSDHSRLSIPWVRVTDTKTGEKVEYRVKSFTNEVNEAEVRTMDCIDCHNRPAHRYKSPNAAVNLALSLGRIDAALPFAKSNAMYALTQTYATKAEAKEKITAQISGFYRGDPRAAKMVEAVQAIYSKNFFPEMKANWSAYPEHIGHKDWPGCFRCHSGDHRTTDGKRTIEASNCESCHTILAQGSGPELLQMTPAGQKFKHPGGDDVGNSCNECHTGGM